MGGVGVVWVHPGLAGRQTPDMDRTQTRDREEERMTDEKETTHTGRSAGGIAKRSDERRFTGMTNTGQDAVATATNEAVADDHRHKERRRDHRVVARPIERRGKMITQEKIHTDSAPLEDLSAGPADDGQWLLLAARESARVTLARAREDAAIGAEDITTQADEALVLG